MKKEQAIEQVQNSIGSVFTKDDVINLINQIELQISIETKSGQPSKQWLDKLMNGVLDIIQDADFTNRENDINIDEVQFSIKYGNQIEIDSFEVDASLLQCYIKSEIEEYFGGIVRSCWDDISEELFPKLVTILKDIQNDVKDYQTENGIGMMDDIQWQQLLVERIIASVESFNHN